MFVRAFDNIWVEQQRLDPDIVEGFEFGASKALFGTSVALVNDLAVVGAPDAKAHVECSTFMRCSFSSMNLGGFPCTSNADCNEPPSFLTGGCECLPICRVGTCIGGANAGAMCASAPDCSSDNCQCTIGPDGTVSIFERNGTTWTLLEVLIGDFANTTIDFGESVDIHNETVVVGDPKDDSVDLGAGIVYVFQRNGVWGDFTQKIAGAMTDEDDRFGTSVSLDSVDGSTLAVGAPIANGTGRVYLFEFNGTDCIEGVTATEPIVSEDASFGHRFGTSVDLEDGVLVVGAPRVTVGSASSTGAAYVFENNGTHFVQTQKLVSPERASNDVCGTSVSIANDTIVVGCPKRDTIFEDTGAADVYKRIGGSYVWIGKMHPFDTDNGQRFGTHVAVYENTIVGGAPLADVTNTNDGGAYVSSCTTIQTC